MSEHEDFRAIDQAVAICQSVRHCPGPGTIAQLLCHHLACSDAQTVIGVSFPSRQTRSRGSRPRSCSLLEASVASATALVPTKGGAHEEPITAVVFEMLFHLEDGASCTAGHHSSGGFRMPKERTQHTRMHQEENFTSPRRVISHTGVTRIHESSSKLEGALFFAQ